MALVQPELSSRRVCKVALVVIMALQLSVIFYYAVQKQGLQIDEVLSYHLANAYFSGLHSPEPQYGRWLEPAFFHDFVLVSSQHRFAYDSVLFNQAKDVHPPFYYVILHTICSSFPDTYSKWYGLSLNAVLFVLCNIYLFLISIRLFRDRFLSLLPSIIWGFSAGAVSTVIFIRMYMLLTTVIVAFIYCHLLLREQDTSPKAVGAMSLVTLVGFLTQYYFLIFAIFWASLHCLLLLDERKLVQLLRYAIGFFGALFMGYLIFPQSIYHVFGSYRGAAAVASLSSISDLPSRLSTMAGILSAQQFGGVLLQLVAIVTCLFVLRLILVSTASPANDRRHAGDPSAPETIGLTFRSARAPLVANFALISLAISATATFAVVAKISPFLTSRYLYFLYPVVSLIAVYGIYWVSSFYVRNTRLLGVGILVLFAMSTTLAHKHGSVDYLYSGYKAVLSTARTYGNYDCVYVTDRLWVVESNVFELANYRRTYIVGSAGVTSLRDTLSDPADEKGIILYIDDAANTAGMLKYVVASAGFESSKFLYSTDYSRTYLVE
jgi:hypothetical protein